MFEQHPVPQQISSYQFRLVGDMTLKQFFQLAGGAVIGLLIYASPLPSIFKWPLIIFFVIMGAAFAFLPLQERPLEEWIAAFFRAIYGPTQYSWGKLGKVQYYATPESAVAKTPGESSTAPSATVPQEVSVAKLEASEHNFLSNLTNMFSLHPKTASAPLTTPAVQPTPSVPVTQPVTTTIQAQEQEIMARVTNPTMQPVQTTTPTTPQPLTPKAGTLFVATPAQPAISIEKNAPVIIPQAPIATPVMTTAPVAQTLVENKPDTTVQAQFSPDAAPPSPATIPNVIVGQVMTHDSKIVEGAIMEITDFQGRPVRALKTNKAGHFMIVTPLPNGSYKINIEKDGLIFEPLQFEAHGTIVPPIAIKAKPNQ